jgi:hypothetical protein
MKPVMFAPDRLANDMPRGRGQPGMTGGLMNGRRSLVEVTSMIEPGKEEPALPL